MMAYIAIIISICNTAVNLNAKKSGCLACQGKIKPMTQEQIERAIKKLPSWSLESIYISALTRTITFSSISELVAAMHKIETIAEAAGHHPDLFIQGKKLNIKLYTHSVRGLTPIDFELAEQINTSLELFKLENPDSKSSIKHAKADPIPTQEVKNYLHYAPQWHFTLKKPYDLSKLFEFKTFTTAIAFAKKIIEYCKATEQQPSIYIYYNRVKVTVVRSQNYIYKKDFLCALYATKAYLQLTTKSKEPS